MGTNKLNCDEEAQRAQQRLARCAAAEVSSKEVQKNLEETRKWLTKEEEELAYNIAVGHDLLELKERVELMAKSLEQPMKISQENLFHIQKSRRGMESVKDDIEQSLLHEGEVIQENCVKMNNLIGKLNTQLKSLFDRRHELELDIGEKVDNQNTEECVKILCTLDLKNIQLPDPPQIKPFSEWMKKTKALIRNSQEERNSSQIVKAQVSQSLVAIGTESFGIWYETNGRLQSRIKQLMTLQDNLFQDYQKICLEIQVLSQRLHYVQEALDEKSSALEIAQMRVERRTQKLNGMELCRDKVVMILYKEMHVIKLEVNKLTFQQGELDTKMKSLVKRRSGLEKKLRLNDISLFTHRDKCLLLRQNFPMDTVKNFRYSKWTLDKDNEMDGAKSPS